MVRRAVTGGGFLLLFMGLGWLGLNVPAYFRVVSPLVVAEAGKGTTQVGEVIDGLLTRGQASPAAMIAEAVPEAWTPERRSRYDELREGEAFIRWAGGPEPYFHAIFGDQVGAEPEAVVTILLPRENREAVRGYLSRSSNLAVQDVLKTRDLSGYAELPPVFTSAGAPLEAAILMAALLEQAGSFAPEESRQWRATVTAALGGDAGALARLEQGYIGLLSLGRILDWAELRTVVEAAGGIDELPALGRLARRGGDEAPLIYAAAVVGREVMGLDGLFREFPREAPDMLRLALPDGEGALRAIWQNPKPVYERPGYLEALPRGVFALAPRLQGFAETSPRAALALKVVLFAAAGFFLVRGLMMVSAPSAWVGAPPARMGEVAVAVLVGLGLWMLVEPGLLRFPPNEAQRFEIKLALGLPTAETQRPPIPMVDQASIISLVFFAIVQALVVILCLMKMRSIRNQGLGPQVKLRLLDNEEALFDLNLYIGLAGTIAALVLLVLQVYQMSLMAAYTSTLFGIVASATFKIGYLRPYRRRLIVEAARTGGAEVQAAAGSFSPAK